MKAKNYDTWKKQLAASLFAGEALELLRSPSTGEISRPDESEREFRARLQQVSRESRDRAVEAHERLGEHRDLVGGPVVGQVGFHASNCATKTAARARSASRSLRNSSRTRRRWLGGRGFRRADRLVGGRPGGGRPRIPVK